VKFYFPFPPAPAPGDLGGYTRITAGRGYTRITAGHLAVKSINRSGNRACYSLTSGFW